MCRAFVAGAAGICGPLDASSPAGALAALALVDEPIVDAAIIDATCEILADLSDLKCRFTRGHSAHVADLAVRAASLLRVPADARVTLRRAALLHDIGRVGVTAAIWDKAGALTDAETERVRSHTLATERILSNTPLLADAAELAALAHERLDGRGYHRRLPPIAVSVSARVLAAADVYQALRSERPQRAAFAAERATALLREEAQDGRLDGQAVEAVLAAAGERPAVRPQAPAGLTEREVQVLGLLARGLTNRQIATELDIAVKTAGNHVQSTLDKVGVRTRSAAAMFAMRHGLAS
jgi:HD-GYP domain-containing protein (c-di-GMP phosphodiesterase class II)